MRIPRISHVAPASPEPIHLTRLVVRMRGDTDSFVSGLPDFIYKIDDSIDDINEILRTDRTISGTFAISLEDKKNGSIYLISDPLGLEAIYYRRMDDGIWRYGFKISDLLNYSDSRKLDFSGLDEMFLYRWLMEEHTMIAGILRVPPGSVVTLANSSEAVLFSYASIHYTLDGEFGSINSVITDTERNIDNYLKSVSNKYRNIGIFLSGGVDSSLIAARAVACNIPIIAYTGMFSDGDNEELDRARQVAKHLGIKHRCIEITDEFIWKSFIDMVQQFESPVSYFNNFVRMRLFEAASTEVDIVLVGEGADGMFSAEVGRAADAARFERKKKLIRFLPSALRYIVDISTSNSKNAILQRINNIFHTTTLDYIRNGGILFKNSAMKGRISAEELIPILSRIRKYDKIPLYINYEFSDNKSAFFEQICQNRGLYTQNRHQYYCYSVLAERYGLRVGAPFLSSYLMAIGLKLPLSFRSDETGAKPILRSLASRYLPHDIVYAPKRGFETPDVAWLSGPLRPYLDILQDETTRKRGLIDPAVAARLDPTRDALLALTAIGLEIFLRQFIDTPDGKVISTDFSRD